MPAGHVQRNPLPESLNPPVPTNGKTMLIRNKQGTKRIAVPSRNASNPEPVASPLPSNQRPASLDYSNSGSSTNVIGKKKKKKKGRKSGQQNQHGTPSGDEGDGQANNGYYDYAHSNGPASPRRQAHLYQRDISQSMAGYDDTDEVPGLIEGDGEGEDEDDDHYEYSDQEGEFGEHDGYSPPPSHPAASVNASKKKNNKKKKKKTTQDHGGITETSAVGHRKGKDRIWNTSTAEERERIKDFWLSLGEDERRSLVKVEKEAVLKKMKEQQKHSCSCSVCGRKRTAIEEELEVLYDAYYEELEQYANQQQGSKYTNHVPTSPPATGYAHAQIPLGPPRVHDPITSHHNDNPSAMDEIDDDEFDDEDDDDEYEDEDEDDLEEPMPSQNDTRPDFFNFGNSLTVQGGILTVADDLLKNDGKKFIEMMEQLAERRMAREEEANTSSNGHQPSGLPMQQPHLVHDHVQQEYDDDEEYDDEEEEEDYDDEEEEDEPDTMTEEQRMEEGRRMFQIFAARMFEQRVLTAYREKVARERQRKLLEELEEESRRNQEREEKRAKEKDKKKEKKRLQKQAKEEERLRKEAEKAAEEAKLKAIESKKAEEQRKRKEEQRLKREAERKAAEEERLRKEEEKRRRLQEEREREAERERKRKEHQERERKKREEAARKAREEKETREKEIKEKREREEREKKEREATLKKEAAERDRRRKEEEAKAKAEATTRRTAPPTAPQSHYPPVNYGSPHLSVVTPAIPKQPVGASPGRPRNPSQQSSMQGSVGSSPKTPQVALPIGTSASPGTPILHHHNMAGPSTLLPNKAFQFPPNSSMPPTSPMAHPIAPPPGVTPPDTAFPGISPMNVNGPSSMHPFVPSMHQRPSLGNGIPGFPPPPIPMGPHPPFRGFASPNGMPMIPPAPGMRGMPQQNRGLFMNDLPPQQLPPGVAGIPMQPPGSPFINRVDPIPIHSHSRAPSGSFDPLHRPTPIQRPSSVAPPPQNNVDELSDVMGSRALLEDDDMDPLQENMSPSRRASGVQYAPRPTRGVPASSPLFSDAMGEFLPSWSNPAPLGALPSSLPSAWGGGASSFNEPLNGYTNRPGWSNTDAARSSFNRRRPGKLDELRILASKVCLEMGGSRSANQFVEMATLQRAVQQAASPDLAFQLGELKDLAELLTIEGDEVNGGGTFYLSRDNSGRSLVQFEEPGPLDRGMEDHSLRVGEIGSPSISGVNPNPVPFRTPLSPAF